jgi:hypothetical protein
VSIPDEELPAVFAHGGAQTFLPTDAPEGLPPVGVPVVVDDPDEGDD